MRRIRFGLWLALAAAIVVAGFSALAVLGAITAIFDPKPGDASLTANILIAVIGAAIIAACVRWAVHTEHRLRSHGAGDAAAAAGTSARGRPYAARYGRGYQPRLHHHRHGPVAVAIAAVIFTLVVAGMAVGTISSYTAWRLSRYVQSQGKAVPASVVSVRNIEHTSRSGTWYTADIRVALAAPVDGVSVSTVHDPQASGLAAGDPLTVLVDPQRPGYAEIPGQPYAGMADWISGIVFTLIFLLLALVYWREIAVHLRDRRRLARQAVPAAASP